MGLTSSLASSSSSKGGMMGELQRVVSIKGETPALAYKEQPVAKRQRARTHKGAELAHTVTGDKRRRADALLLDGAKRRDAGCQDGGLSIDRVIQLVGWSVEAKRRQSNAQDAVSLGEDLTSRW